MKRTIAPIPRITRTFLPKKKAIQTLLENPVLIVRELHYRRFYNFFKFFWSEVSAEELKDNWHIEYLCDELQKVVEGIGANKVKVNDILINIPPGTTKTTIISVMLPAWCWTRWYWMKVIAVSYSATISLEAAELCRDLILSEKFQMVYPEIGLKEDKNTKSNFRVVLKKGKVGKAKRLYYGGGRFSTSVGGSLTGMHGHLLIVDDPSNPGQAASLVELKSTNQWLSQTLTTRKIDKLVAVTITVMQRLHQNDYSGYQLERKKTKLKHICLPGEISNEVYRKMVKPPELIDRYQDNLLDPVRLPMEALKEMEADLGQYGYAGQVGQSPTSPTGGMFKVDKFQIIDQMPAEVSIVHSVRFWDKAGTAELLDRNKAGKGPAYTVGTKMHKIANGKWIISDVIRGRYESHERERLILSTAELDGHNVEVYHEQEPGSGGKQSAQATTINLAGFHVEADLPKGDKVYRADPYSVQVNEGNVLLLRGEWNHEFIEEHRFFPVSTFKDQVDASSGAFSKLTSKKQVKVY